MARKVSIQELLELLNEGSSLSVEERKFVIEGMDDLKSLMQKSIEQSKEDTDRQVKAINDAADKITTALKGNKIDVSAIIKMLSVVMSKPGRKFKSLKVIRNSNDLTEEIMPVWDD